MRNLLKPFGIIVLVAIIGFSMMSCVTMTSIGGAVGAHGFFTGNGGAAALNDGAQEIASYSVWLGLFDTGYADYAEAVKQAEASGKKITSATKWYYIFNKVTAYAK